MPELRIHADDFQIGDLVHRDDGPPIEIRTIDRRDGGVLAVNDGQPDEMHGFVWQAANVTRPEGSSPQRWEETPAEASRYDRYNFDRDED